MRAPRIKRKKHLEVSGQPTLWEIRVFDLRKSEAITETRQILRNSNFTNPKGEGQGIGGGDGMTAHSTHHVWVDHCHFNECADGQFNNYYAATRNNTCIGLGILSQVLLESSYFDGIKRPWKSRSEPGQTEGRLQTNDDMVYTFGPKIQMGKTARVDFKPPYAYKLDAAKDVKDIVRTHAGVGKGPFAAMP